MCGVAGVVGEEARLASADLRDLGDRMGLTMRHRGPDDAGVWVDRRGLAMLSHRRLAVVDLSAEGHQPMVSGTGRFVLTYNGEIYNAAQIRQELEKSAVRFRGHSDTEVLLAAMETWGVRETVRQCNGMFAFGLWDCDEATLYLARDRFGEKPLYVHHAGNVVSFASTTRALRTLPWFEGQIDRLSVAQYFIWGAVPAPGSIYRGVGQISPGTIVTFRRAEGWRPHRHTYWSAPEAAVAARAERRSSHPGSRAVAELDSRLEEAVRARMVADVPLGAFLSGGIDSSLVVALMQKASTKPVRTFSIGFAGDPHDEAPYASAVAKHLGTDHTNIYLSSQDVLSAIPRLVELNDVPLSDTAQLPTYLMSVVTRAQVTVSLSGDGGDELFGGYERYRTACRMWRTLRTMPHGIRAPLGRVAESAVGRSGRGLLGSSLGGAGDRAFARLTTQGARVARLVGARWPVDVSMALAEHWPEPPVLGWGGAEFGERRPSVVEQPGHRSTWLEQMMVADQVTYLPDVLLPKVDRAAMAVGLETRMPFLDPSVFEFASSLDDDLRGPPATKQILRDALRVYLPGSLVDRPKKGFGVPVAGWLRGELSEWAEDLLSADRLRADGLLDATSVCTVWRAHKNGRQDYSGYLWDVLMFQAWLATEDRGGSAECGAARPVTGSPP